MHPTPSAILPVNGWGESILPIRTRSVIDLRSLPLSLISGKYWMNRIKRFLVIITAFILLCLALPAPPPIAAQETMIIRDPFLSLLSRTPDLRATDGVESGVIRYVNFSEIMRVGDGMISSTASYERSEEQRDAWRGAMRRVAVAPDFFGSVLTLVSGMVESVGLDWFDLSAALEFGAPPNVGVWLDFSSGDYASLDRETMTTALTKRGFEQRAGDGVTVWWRFEDNAISPKERDVTDPFGGTLGAAARIQVYEGENAGLVGNARSWALAETMIATVSGDAASLIDAPDYAVLAEAITDSAYILMPQDDGQRTTHLLQVYIIPGTVGAIIDAPEGEALPPYSLVALVDRQERSLNVHAIVLVYPTAEDAARAKDILGARLKVALPERLVSENKVDFDAPYVHTRPDGWSAVVVGVRYPSPEEGSPTQPGLVYMYMDAQLNRLTFTPIGLKP